MPTEQPCADPAAESDEMAGQALTGRSTGVAALIATSTWPGAGLGSARLGVGNLGARATRLDRLTVG
jgi:hypothetical protein